jgi:hypothetical protein
MKMIRRVHILGFQRSHQQRPVAVNTSPRAGAPSFRKSSTESTGDKKQKWVFSETRSAVVRRDFKPTHARHSPLLISPRVNPTLFRGTR